MTNIQAIINLSFLYIFLTKKIHTRDKIKKTDAILKDVYKRQANGRQYFQYFNEINFFPFAMMTKYKHKPNRQAIMALPKIFP